MSVGSPSSFKNRVIRATILDVSLYEEVEADKESLGQAMGVVVLASVASGIGNIFSGGVWGIVGGTIAALIGWFIWAGLTYVIGTKILPEPQTESDMVELLRTIGFASAPGLLRVFTFVPIFGWLVGVIVGIWMLLAMVVAVRQALDYTSTLRAVGVCLIGWLVQLAAVLAFLVFGAGITAPASGPT